MQDNKLARAAAEHYLRQCAERFGLTWSRVTMAANLQPVPAPRMTARDRWKKRDCVTRYLDFKTALRTIAAQQDLRALPEVLNVLFVMPTPAKASKKDVARRLYTYHKQRPDRDNMLKAVQDAFDGDDSHCADGRTTKIWGLYPMVIFYE